MLPSPTTICSLALVALVTAGLGARAVVPRLGDAMARSVLLAATAVHVPSARPGDGMSDPAPSQPATDTVLAASAPDPGTERFPGRSRPTGGLDIPAERLARLTARQLRGLGATDAMDASGHALGARLSGVSSLGLGLADGDIVTSIDGRATPDAAQAAGAALTSYASGARMAHATVLRGGRTLHVTLHIPGHAAPT